MDAGEEGLRRIDKNIQTVKIFTVGAILGSLPLLYRRKYGIWLWMGITPIVGMTGWYYWREMTRLTTHLSLSPDGTLYLSTMTTPLHPYPLHSIQCIDRSTPPTFSTTLSTLTPIYSTLHSLQSNIISIDGMIGEERMKIYTELPGGKEIRDKEEIKEVVGRIHYPKHWIIQCQKCHHVCEQYHHSERSYQEIANMKCTYKDSRCHNHSNCPHPLKDHNIYDSEYYVLHKVKTFVPEEITVTNRVHNKKAEANVHQLEKDKKEIEDQIVKMEEKRKI